MREELFQMVRLAGPLVLAELGWMAMGVVDTMFVGRVGAEAIGAVGLGTMVFYGIAISSGGLLLGLDTLVARHSERATGKMVTARWCPACG